MISKESCIDTMEINFITKGLTITESQHELDDPDDRLLLSYNRKKAWNIFAWAMLQFEHSQCNHSKFSR